MRLFGWFRRPKIDPVDFAEQLCLAYGEENLKVLNSCEEESFKLTLTVEFNSTSLIPRFKDLEDAVNKTKKIIEAANYFCEAPIKEEDLIFFCKCLKCTLFYG